MYKKSLGQNFLRDKNKIKEIVEANKFLKNRNILEVGPGDGELTIYLDKLAKELVVVEKDLMLKEKLLKKNLTKTTFIFQDFLEFDLKSLFPSEDKIAFFSNLPYYIATPILFMIIEDKRFESLSFMIQKELSERICAQPGTRKYGRLSVMINTYFLLENKISVPRNCFSPTPNVDSCFLIMKRKKTNLSFSKYSEFVRFCFQHKRKTLFNSLCSYHKFKKELFNGWLIKENLSNKVRAEELTLSQFETLYKLFLDK